MKKLGFVFSLMTVMAVMTVGCGNEEEHFHAVDMSVSGVELTKGVNSITFHGELPAAGGEVVFTAGKNENNAYLGYLLAGKSEVVVHDQDINPTEIPYVIYAGDECKVEITSLEPRVTKMKVYANNDGLDREFTLKFGCCYRESYFVLVQKGSK